MPRKAATSVAKGARKVATTPCPRCGKAIAVHGERGACPACGLGVRFVDAPERPCLRCGKPLAVPPGQDAVRCEGCGTWEAADPRRPLSAQARCPRCGRDVQVPLDRGEAPCPRCGTALSLGPPVRDTL